MYTLILFSLLVLGTLVMDWVYSRKARSLLSNLPGYPRLPLLGSIFYLMGGPRNLYKRLIEASEKSEQTRLPFVAWVGPVPLVVVTEPEDVKLATNALPERPYYYQFAKIWLGDGLFIAPARIWQQNIKKIASTFSSNIVEGYQEVFNIQAQKLVQKLKHEAGKTPFDVMYKYLANTTLETICQTALGESQTSESIVTIEYHLAFTRIIELMMHRSLNIFYHSEIIFRQTSFYKEMVKCVAVLHNISNTVIKRRKEQREKVKTKHESEKRNENNTTNFKSFLDILLDMQEQDQTWTLNHIKEEVDGVILAGQETVAFALLYIFLMIGSKPNVQEKVYYEVKGIFGESNRNVEKKDLVRMEYCEAVVLETLRLYPSTPIALRYADQDLKMGSCTIPAGSTVGINGLGAGRSRRQWGDDALEFRPERWINGNPADPAAFLAFSYGKRSCIGKRYSLSLLKTILAHCVRELKFTSRAEELKMKVDLFLRPVAGHLIQVDIRN